MIRRIIAVKDLRPSLLAGFTTDIPVSRHSGDAVVPIRIGLPNAHHVHV